MGDPASRDKANDETTVFRDLPVQCCPACSTRLMSRRCKMVCPRCGYFRLGSEFE